MLVAVRIHLLDRCGDEGTIANVGVLAEPGHARVLWAEMWGAAVTRAAIVYIAAALAEIGGCFAFWAWARGTASILWLAPGLVLLVGFAWLLTLAPTDAAGRAFAAYGGIYIVASLGWLWLVEGVTPDRYDIAGSLCCLVGAGIILARPGAA